MCTCHMLMSSCNHTRICVCVRVCAHTRACVCARLMSGIFLSPLHLIYGESLAQNVALPHLAPGARQLALGIPRLCLPSTGFAASHHTCLAFMWELGIWTLACAFSVSTLTTSIWAVPRKNHFEGKDGFSIIDSPVFFLTIAEKYLQTRASSYAHPDHNCKGPQGQQIHPCFRARWSSLT